MIKGRLYSLNTYFLCLAGIFLLFALFAVFLSQYWIAIIPFGILLLYYSWQNFQFIFFLLILSLPWSIEYSFNSSLGTDLPDEPFMLLIAGLFLAKVFYKNSAESKTLGHPLIFLISLYFGWIMVTVPFSTDWFVSLKFLLAKTWYLLAFVFMPLLIFKNRESIKIAGGGLLISMLIVVIIVLCRHASHGFRFSEINVAVSPFFRNHVNYSAMLVCMVPILIATYQISKKHRILIALMVIIVVAALILSYARGAWLALLVGLISYWLVNRQKLLLAFIASVILTIAAAFWLGQNDRYLSYSNDYKTTIFHTNFREHLIATYRLKDLSTAERLNRWVAGVRMIKDNWLMGYGPNTFYNNYKPYTIPVFKTWVSDNKEHSTVHNYFLFVFIEQGIPGLLFFLLLTGGMLYYSEKLYKRIQDRFYKAVTMGCGVMIMMILAVNFLSDLVESDKVGSLFFLCAATLISVDLNARKKINHLQGQEEL
ncbi:MAG TPA: O-antigen ligase family protein [Chitinophagaceae bacterium]